MTTPNTTNIPAPRVPFVDERTGLISREWFRFLNNQFQLTGGGTTAISLADLELAPYSDAATEAELTVTQSRVEALELAPRPPELTPVSFGSFFSTQTRVIWRRLGATMKSRDRVYEVSGTDPVIVAIMGAELQLSPTTA